MPILVTGGARSGKSSFAERLCAMYGDRGIYIATAQLYDDEMRERVAMHRAERDQAAFEWKTMEEPYELIALLSDLEGSKMILVDCLTLWLSNILLRCEADPNANELVKQQIDQLVELVRHYAGTLIFVTNEVGSGIVPEYPLGRQYRDLAGYMNRKLAEVCEQVYLVTAGIPIELKSRAAQL
ncbi:bifunctional adenosylcobinamide kinase/adenosylcobinamide-phosphate guanylyltransferase [Paenibacillus guangzhouensis]|uniref:bifunctional adenosylcobinamide kinase/adenosylcobinamide-phosphate guanylyltransferase n=1 Tax=Paenibacillus guangzhouensis TaxID=1473112 RepID=UPI00126718FA|nr:bifunctional adenosylcobinamide kinase/adenosylcobinamide-phosphate guanylyltransferase [Paenibacillus guangzhouensis]